jgi:uncharacterized protein YydD (DUF2326 family)
MISFLSDSDVFGEIVDEMVDLKALLGVSPNPAGHLVLKAEILDESGNATSADLGHTYLKLLWIAFDMAVLRSHLDDKPPRFVYQDEGEQGRLFRMRAW